MHSINHSKNVAKYKFTIKYQKTWNEINKKLVECTLLALWYIYILPISLTFLLSFLTNLLNKQQCVDNYLSIIVWEVACLRQVRPEHGPSRILVLYRNPHDFQQVHQLLINIERHGYSQAGSCISPGLTTRITSPDLWRASPE